MAGPLDFVPTPVVTTVVDALEGGRSVLVVGPWGTGKTTLLRTVTATSSLGPTSGPTSGAAVCDDVHRAPLERQEALAAGIVEGAPVLLASTPGLAFGPTLHRALVDSNAVIVRIGALSLVDASTLLDRSGITVPPDAVRSLWRRSAGIGRLLRAAGTRSVSATADFGTDLMALVRALRAELESDDPEVLAALELLSVTGRMPLPMVTRLCTNPVVDRLIAGGLAALVAGPDGDDVRIVAEVLGEELASGVSLDQRSRLLRRTVEVSVESGPRAAGLDYRVRRGLWHKAIDGDLIVIRDAMDAALIQGRFDVVIELGRHALSRDSTDLGFAHVTAIAFEAKGDHAGAIAISRLAPTEQDTAWRMRVAADTYLVTGQMPAADENVVASDPTLEGQGHLSWLRLFAGDVAGASEVADTVLAAPAATPQAVIWAALAKSTSDVILGEGRSALSVLDRAETLTSDAGVNPFASLQLGIARAEVLVRSGHFIEAYEFAKSRADAETIPQIAAAWHGFAGLAAREQGRFDAAVEHLQAVVEATSGDPFGLVGLARTELDACEAMIGAGTQPPSWPSASDDSIALFRPLALRNRAWCACVDNEPMAIELARRAADEAASHGQRTHEVLALVDLARFGRATEALSRVRDLRLFDNSLVRISAQIIAALAEPSTRQLLTATASAHTIDWRVPRDELAILAIARLLRNGEIQRAARVELRWAPTRWPTPIGRTPLNSSLTAREAEVARLAISGRATAEIAAELTISTRTVDNLLGRVYAKCGVAGRRELANAVTAAQ